MIKLIRNLLCTSDPMSIMLLIVIVLFIVAEIFVLGITEFLITVGIGIVLAAIVIGVCWLLYKSIVLLQRFCK